MSKCSKCRFGWYSDIEKHTACEYLLITGNVRGCPADNSCTRFEPKSGKKWRKPKTNKEDNTMAKAKLTEEQKRSIVTESQAGAKVGELAAKYNIGKSSIYNVLADYKEHGERSFTSDTDTDAEKEPATAATETDSEQETCDDVPADIITDIPENVKSPHEFSPMAADAVWRKIEELREEAAELLNSETAFEKIIADCKDKIRCLDDQLINVEAEIDILMGDYEAMTGAKT